MSRMQRVRRSLAARLRASARAARRAGPLLVLALLLVGIGVALRVQHLGRPGAFAFDEHHFVENARRFLSRRHDANDHPALGKLLMLPSMWLLGDRGMGWRGAQLVAGLALIVLAGTLGARLFRDRRAGWLAAAFVAADGLLVVYSRVALLDGFLGCFAMLAVWLSVRARGPLGHAGAGAAIGAAAAIKVSGAALGLPALALALRSRRPVLSALALGAAPVVFTAQGVLGRVISRESASPLNFWRSTL
ncbi:MAG: phospholipid carrier-dependent glycosyltransferase, partial [Deltaproteobacteria bacterium]|nr:phospholipid carrier-dependent glycosyltransferase [Deltaproteobacteria bacterium]